AAVAVGGLAHPAGAIGAHGDAATDRGGKTVVDAATHADGGGDSAQYRNGGAAIAKLAADSLAGADGAHGQPAAIGYAVGGTERATAVAAGGRPRRASARAAA